MRKVLVSKVACETALGAGPEQLWEQLLAGSSGIRPLTRFNCENYTSSLAAGIDDLVAPSGGSRHEDLLNRLADQLGPVPADSQLLVASTKGEIDRLEASCRRSEPVPREALFEPLLEKVSRRFALADCSTNINAACASSTIALARAAALIAHGQAESVLIYAADLLSEFVFSGFSALQALSPTPARPFDVGRQGLNLGEAGAVLLLTSEQRLVDK
ncbi:MAG: beta-ketoacyl synthase, partial [Desulfuromonas sp.]